MHLVQFTARQAETEVPNQLLIVPLADPEEIDNGNVAQVTPRLERRMAIAFEQRSFWNLPNWQHAFANCLAYGIAENFALELLPLINRFECGRLYGKPIEHPVYESEGTGECLFMR